MSFKYFQGYTVKRGNQYPIQGGRSYMDKDRLYGGLILIAAILLLALFLIAFFAPYLEPIIGIPASLSWWAVAIPVFLLVVLALGIVMWIGWTMFTTPPPVPIGEEEGEEPQSTEDKGEHGK
jgi:protein-S-isoprenylcysteine O-methyltransferase Ste14